MDRSPTIGWTVPSVESWAGSLCPDGAWSRRRVVQTARVQTVGPGVRGLLISIRTGGRGDVLFSHVVNYCTSA